jgi:hypothetical protein
MLPILVRYTNYYQFGDTFMPSLEEDGSAEQWFYFRIIHRMRVQWENEKQERESKNREENARQNQGQASRPREEKPKREVRPERAAEEGREMTHAEKVAAAQERFGIEPHKPPELLKRKPKNFKSTRVKRKKTP